MKVIKRSGDEVPMLFDKVTKRIHKLCADLEGVQADKVAQKVFSSMYDGIKTSDVDALSADVSIDMVTENPNYETLATRIIVSDMHKNCPKCFSDAMVGLHIRGVVSDYFMKCVALELDAEIQHDRDYDFGFFGIKTMQKSYLNHGETPQYMFMRVAVGIHGDDRERVRKTYEFMSKKYFIHATPTLFNAGSNRPQMSSCFLLGIKDDSIGGIYQTAEQCAHISKWSGGIGMHVHNVRAKGSRIAGTNGQSDGIIPMLRVFNATARYVNQCFRGDTLVYSTRGPVRIEDVKIGDKLTTIDGTSKSVLGVVRNHVNKNILKIRPMHSMEPVFVTGEHEIYAIQNQASMLNHSVIKNRLVKKIVEPSFVSADSLKRHDLVGFPIPKEISDFDESVDYFRMYGIMIGDGYVTKRGYECGVCLGTEKKADTIEFVLQFLKNRGLRSWVSIDDTKHTVSIRWSNNIDVLHLPIYDTNRVKKIDPRFLHLPIPKTHALIKGLMETDGGITHEIQFYNTSKNVMYSLRYLLLRLGVLTSGHFMDNVGQTHEIRPGEFITNRLSSWAIRIPKHPALAPIFGNSVTYSTTIKYFEHDGILWSRIRSIGSEHHEGYVYDLNMQDNHNYLTDMGLVHNSGRRKGSIAVYLEPWHADIMEFLDLRLNQGDEEARCRDLFTAMWVPDLFMEKVEQDSDWHLMCPNECPGLADVHGEEFNELYRTYVAQGRFRKVVKARQVWDSVLRSQIETGTPYMLYKDSCNAKSNQKNLGTIKSSNLCVAPETKILTRSGYQRIDTLCGMTELWNGEEWSVAHVEKTSDSAQLIRVNFSDGTYMDCTAQHKFHLQIGYCTKTEMKEAQALVPGDRLIKWTAPGPIQYGPDMEYAYTHGFFCGDGTYHSTYSGQKTIPSVSLYGEKKNLMKYLDIRSTSGNEDAQGRINTMLPYDLPKKFVVPHDKSVKSRLEWFAGLCDADGHTQGCPGNPTQKTISVASIHLSFLRDVQLMLHTLGVSSVIGLLREAGETELPDGKGGKKMFDTQTCWRLVVSALGVETLINAGLTTHRLDLSDFTPVTRDVRQYVRVVSVEDNGRMDATYCFNEPKRHMGIFNGVIAGNCVEIVQHTSPEEVAVCNLASISLPAFVSDGEFSHTALHDISRLVTRNLNRVIDRNFYPVPEAEKSNKRHRPIAIGVQGLADVFMMLGLAFDSLEAAKLNKDIFETIYHGALTESCQLAKEEGTYETFRDSPAEQGKLQFDLWGVTPSRPDWEELKHEIHLWGLRNSLLVGPMPTASTAQILGNNEAFEPYTTNLYLRRTLAGEFVMINKHLVKDLQAISMWNKDTKDHIIRDGGSVQSLTIPQRLKDIYKTAWEMSQKVLIDMAADRGAFVCQSQSLNIFMENPSMAKLSSMHMYGWKKGLKSGMYYLRTRAKAKPIQFTLDPVQACRRDNPEGCEMCSA